MWGTDSRVASFSLKRLIKELATLYHVTRLAVVPPFTIFLFSYKFSLHFSSFNGNCMQSVNMPTEIGSHLDWQLFSMCFFLFLKDNGMVLQKVFDFSPDSLWLVLRTFSLDVKSHSLSFVGEKRLLMTQLKMQRLEKCVIPLHVWKNNFSLLKLDFVSILEQSNSQANRYPNGQITQAFP